MNSSNNTGLRLLLTFLWIGCLLDKTSAQLVDSGGIRSLLEKVNRTYRQADHLSFAVKYVYTDAGLQSADSLLGTIQLDKLHCRMVIDNTESVVTDKYAIRVITDNKLIYVSGKPNTGMPDLLSMTDSLLAHVRSVRIQRQGSFRVMTIDMPPGQVYSRVEMTIDTVTGYLQRVAYSIHTAGLVGKEMVESPGHPAPYQAQGVITALFSRYEHGRFDDNLFDETKYFTRSAGRFEPAGRYKDYQIFLASSNL